MNHFLVPPLLVALTTWATHAQAAEPMPAEELGRTQVTSPTLEPCKKSSGIRENDCIDAPLQDLTNKSIKESLTSDPAYQAPQPPAPQLPPPPEVSPQQQQIIDDFTHLPWGR